MKNIENEYKRLIEDILLMGKEKDDRTGTGTYSLFGKTIEHDMALGFPLMTSKKIAFNNAKIELLWILNGRTDLAYLEDNGVNYWRPDYERSGRTDGTLGPVYGKQWRDFNGVDQLKNLLQEIKTNPTSRRLMVSAWAPHEMNEMALPPCHDSFQVYINNGKVDLLWRQRSADVFLGLPYDIAMYGLLLELIAEGMRLESGRLIGQLGDCHLYKDHLEQAGIYLNRPQWNFPRLKLDKGLCLGIDGEVIVPDIQQIKISDYNPEPAIKAPLSVGKLTTNI